jgi:hypothetical protein
MMDGAIATTFFAGVIGMGYATAGVFFLRFWTRTRDKLFFAFAIAFWLMAVNQALPVLLQIPSEDQSGVFLLRLAAFGLIILAIVIKNVRRPDDG